MISRSKLKEAQDIANKYFKQNKGINPDKAKYYKTIWDVVMWVLYDSDNVNLFEEGETL